MLRCQIVHFKLKPTSINSSHQKLEGMKERQLRNLIHEEGGWTVRQPVYNGRWMKRGFVYRHVPSACRKQKENICLLFYLSRFVSDTSEPDREVREIKRGAQTRRHHNVCNGAERGGGAENTRTRTLRNILRDRPRFEGPLYIETQI